MLRNVMLRCRFWRRPEPFLLRFSLSLWFCTVGLLFSGQSLYSPYPVAASAQTAPIAPQSLEQLPAPDIHPLPDTLAQWQDIEEQGDYFSAIAPTPVGYLVWSVFPIQVWVEPVSTVDMPFEVDRAQAWIEAIAQAMQEWNAYLPLERVDSSETANITIWRSAPPIELPDRDQPEHLDAPERDSNQSRLPDGNNRPSNSRHALPRIRSAETRYQLFVDRPHNAPARLSHRFIIHLTPNQTPAYIQATARHEIGHALGIWGHSSVETDALYFSQVRNAPSISDRDVNTLKRIYQQPTQVGWDLITEHQ